MVRTRKVFAGAGWVFAAKIAAFVKGGAAVIVELREYADEAHKEILLVKNQFGILYELTRLQCAVGPRAARSDPRGPCFYVLSCGHHAHDCLC